MTYRKLTIPELGELEFCGNTGAFAEFESESGVSLAKIAADKTVSVYNMYLLLFWCHYVASKRLKKDVKVTREDLKYFVTGKNLIDTVTGLISVILEDMGLSPDAKPEPVEEKKS